MSAALLDRLRDVRHYIENMPDPASPTSHCNHRTVLSAAYDIINEVRDHLQNVLDREPPVSQVEGMDNQDGGANNDEDGDEEDQGEPSKTVSSSVYAHDYD